MLKRGDTAEKAENRLEHDRTAFQGFCEVCSKIYSTGNFSPDELAKDVYTWIMSFENENNELKLTSEQIQRNDDIDNAVYNMLLVLLEKDEEQFPWNINIIGDVTDAISAVCEKKCLHIRHPGIFTEVDNRQYYKE